MDKKESQRIHATLRAMERHGIALNKQARRQAIKDIQTGRAKFLWRTSLRVTAWEVSLDGKNVRVVYDRQRKSLVTVLPDAEVVAEQA
jgi:hypothetical protein